MFGGCYANVTTLRLPYDSAILFVVCLSSVTFVQPTHKVELFANILHHLIEQRLVQFVLKFEKEIRKDTRWPCMQVNYKGVWKIGFFSTSISLYFKNGIRYGNCYNRRRIETCMRSIEWRICNDLGWPLTEISWSQYYSTSNNSKMVQDKAILIQWQTNSKSAALKRREWKTRD